MQVIKDLHSRDLYAPLRTYLDPDIEPMAGPRDPLPRIGPAEAVTHFCVDDDDEGDRSGDLPEGAGIIIAAAIVGSIAGLAMFAHWLAGVLL